MVLLYVKKGDESLFLIEASVQTHVSDLTPLLVKLQNYRLRIQRLILAVEDLVEYGLYKPEAMQGYTEEEIECIGRDVPEEQVFIQKHGLRFLLRRDPTGRRCGESPIDIAETIRKELASAKLLVSAEMVAANRKIQEAELLECINLIKAALTIAYPMGLPEYEPVKYILEDNEDLSGTQASKDVFEVENTSLWWASKELTTGKKLMDFVGKNEKTKIIVKMQMKGRGAPVKEAALSEDAQKNLMAYYFRKQEEQKRLAENEEDDYLNSSWANNKSLKSAFNGIGNVSWRP